MSKQTPTSHLVGLTKCRRKRIHQSSSPGNNRGRAARLVSYCPECQKQHPADPENDIHITVTAKTKIGTCKNGHSWYIT